MIMRGLPMLGDSYSKREEDLSVKYLKNGPTCDIYVQ
jgi:hypothetical protein